MQILVIEGQSEYGKLKEDGNRKRKRRTTTAGSRRRTGDQHHPGEDSRTMPRVEGACWSGVCGLSVPYPYPCTFIRVVPAAPLAGGPIELITAR